MNKAVLKLLFHVVLFCVVAMILPLRLVRAELPAELSPESKACVTCHQKENTSIYQQWGASKHFRANVGCYECHRANGGDPDAFTHYDQTISTIVSPKDCATCHTKEVAEFTASHHAKAGRILGSLDNFLADVVEGGSGMKTEGFPHGISAASVNGCWQCHGAEVKVLDKNGKLDPATWPNSGMGRLNPDGSEGSCTACHSRHKFSAAQARNPENCGKCHMGPDHPQLEIYNESKHGIAYNANKDKMNMESSKWVVGEDYDAAPTCATCHMSATKTQPVTHDVGLRISWNNRPPVSVRPEVADAKLGLESAKIGWETRRDSMKDVCRSCHNKDFTDNFYVQYDELIKLYNDKFATPGLKLMALAKPLTGAPEFASKVDFTWFEIWHHEGRRARHGASMMGPDYTHWHGTYEVAKNFYTEFIPELREIVKENLASKDPKKVEAAKALDTAIAEVLKAPDHAWYTGQEDPAVKAERAKRQKEYMDRYSK
jgi:formate-dependent nitrite reductase cytochrome c552 subunit